MLKLSTYSLETFPISRQGIRLRIPFLKGFKVGAESYTSSNAIGVPAPSTARLVGRGAVLLPAMLQMFGLQSRQPLGDSVPRASDFLIAFINFVFF